MSTRAMPLTPEQKQICKNNQHLFAEQIAQLPGMEGTSKRQIRDYIRHPPRPTYAHLADEMEAFIAAEGLPREHAAVFEYIRYLRKRS